MKAGVHPVVTAWHIKFKPLLAVAGIFNSEPGAAIHRNVALWFRPNEYRNAFAVRVGPPVNVAMPDVVTGAGSFGSSWYSVGALAGVPTVVPR